MNTLLAFPGRNGKGSNTRISRFRFVFKKNIVKMFNSNLLQFRFQEPAYGLYKDETSVNEEKSSSFNYDEWNWEDISGSVYVDNLKKLHPDLSHIFIFKDYRSVVNTLLERDFRSIDRENMHKRLLGAIVWRYFKRKNAIRQFYKKNAPRYLKIWLEYNDGFLKNIKQLPRDSYVLLDEKNISPDDARVCAYLLKNWNLSLKYFRFKQVGNHMNMVNSLTEVLTDM